MKVKEFVGVWNSVYPVCLYDGEVFLCETVTDNVLVSGDEYFGTRDVKSTDISYDDRLIITL